MANIIKFPTQNTKVYSLMPEGADTVETLTAVNELTCELLAEVLPIYIERGWSLAELDAVVYDFTSLMVASAPPHICRADLDELKKRLRPIWKDLMASVRGPASE
jgi:hypothetical protein